MAVYLFKITNNVHMKGNINSKYHIISFHSFSLLRSLQDYKIHMDIEIVIYIRSQEVKSV